MFELTKGANAPLPVDTVRLALTWHAPVAVDLSALLVDGDGVVGGDDDFVFYNQPRHPSGAVYRIGAPGPGSDQVVVTTSAAPDWVQRVVVVASVDGATFAALGAARLDISDAVGPNLAGFTLTGGPETAMVVAEIYRRGTGWKVRAVAQGYHDGLAGLARDYGITVDDAAPAAPPPAGPRQAGPGPVPPGMLSGAGQASPIDWLNPPVPSGYQM